MTTPGENKSIWFDAERLDKIEQIIAVYEGQTGIRVSRSAVVMRAVDELFLAVCLSKKPNDVSTTDQPVAADPVPA